MNWKLLFWAALTTPISWQIPETKALKVSKTDYHLFFPRIFSWEVHFKASLGFLSSLVIDCVYHTLQSSILLFQGKVWCWYADCMLDDLFPSVLRIKIINPRHQFEKLFFSNLNSLILLLYCFILCVCPSIVKPLSSVAKIIMNNNNKTYKQYRTLIESMTFLFSSSLKCWTLPDSEAPFFKNFFGHSL